MEGQKLVARYQIKKLPTILLQGDLIENEALKQIWQGVGTIEEDNNFVFRTTELIGNYFDLETKKVEKAKLEE